MNVLTNRDRLIGTRKSFGNAALNNSIKTGASDNYFVNELRTLVACIQKHSFRIGRSVGSVKRKQFPAEREGI